jgi:hypothetical protein
MKSELSQLEQVLRANNAGKFITTVTGILDSKADYLLLSLRAFYNEPELLYTALAYASARGVAVLMTPDPDGDSSPAANQPNRD